MDKLLEYKHVSFSTLVAADRGSGATRDMATWRPELPDGWSYLGQAASPDYTTSPKSVIVRALQPDVLKDVVDWVLVWKSEGSRKPLTCALWRGVPPSDDYAVVGGIFTTNAGWGRPTKDQTSGIKAVRKDALKMIDGSTLTGTLSNIWLDKGSGATRHGSVWTVVPHTDYPSDVSYPFSMIPAGDDGDWKQPMAQSCYILAAQKTVYATTAQLAYQVVTANKLMASDRGSRDKCGISTWRPDLPDGWYCFGETASGDDTKPPRTVIGMALQPDVLKDAVDWKLDSFDKGSDGSTWHGEWRGIPPSDQYYVLTAIFSNLTGWPRPTEVQTSGIKALPVQVLGLLLQAINMNDNSGALVSPHAVGSGLIFLPDTA